jgi:dienelactone hydrolase
MGSRRSSTRSSNNTLWTILAIVGGPLLLLLLACGGAIYWVAHTFTRVISNAVASASNLEIQDQDYAEARSQFQTRLLRHGPAPQRAPPVGPVRGATEVEYPSGNLRLKAWMTPAVPGVRKPAVLFLHGGFSFGADDWQMAGPYQYAGFVVLTPWLRGENGQAGDFTLFYDEVNDVLAAAEYLARQPHVDSTRIYIAGHSAGGTLTLLAAQASRRFRAAASFSGSPDQDRFARTNPEYLVFDPNNLREFILRSPLAFAASFKCPVRMYYGYQDAYFGPTTEHTAQIAKQHNLDVEAVGVLGDHFTSVGSAMPQSIEFFQSR